MMYDASVYLKYRNGSTHRENHCAHRELLISHSVYRWLKGFPHESNLLELHGCDLQFSVQPISGPFELPHRLLVVDVVHHDGGFELFQLGLELFLDRSAFQHCRFDQLIVLGQAGHHLLPPAELDPELVQHVLGHPQEFHHVGVRPRYSLLVGLNHEEASIDRVQRSLRLLHGDLEALKVERAEFARRVFDCHPLYLCLDLLNTCDCHVTAHATVLHFVLEPRQRLPHPVVKVLLRRPCRTRERLDPPRHKRRLNLVKFLANLQVGNCCLVNRCDVVCLNVDHGQMFGLQLAADNGVVKVQDLPFLCDIQKHW
eukprot:m.450252 g.450252  ORF g.450252 m.450252 type:complete len:313 (-) comp19952_c0_seq1:477-1415(-)